MKHRHLLFVLAFAALTAATLAQQSAPAAQPADAKVAASIKDAVAGAKFTRIEGGDVKIERTVWLPSASAKTGAPDAEVLYQVGVNPKDNTAIFLPVRTAPSESADTAKLIDQALSQMTMSSAAGQIEACAGERTCAKVCGTGEGEYCCKWKCEKSK